MFRGDQKEIENDEFLNQEEISEKEYDPDNEFETTEVYFTEILCDVNGMIFENVISQHDSNEIFIPSLKRSKGQILIAFKSVDEKSIDDLKNIVLTLLANPMMRSQIEVQFQITFLENI